MVKSLASLLVAALFIAGIAVLEYVSVNREFEAFGQELSALYEKTEEERANGEDAKAALISWEQKKERLHVWIPHNDIARVDDYLSEAAALISEQDYSAALGKLKIVVHLCRRLPATYRPSLDNIF